VYIQPNSPLSSEPRRPMEVAACAMQAQNGKRVE